MGRSVKAIEERNILSVGSVHDTAVTLKDKCATILLPVGRAPLRKSNSDKQRQRLMCNGEDIDGKKTCTWKCNSVLVDTDEYSGHKITLFENVHTCVNRPKVERSRRTDSIPGIDRDALANIINPAARTGNADAIRRAVKDSTGVNLTYTQGYKLMQKALGSTAEEQTQQFAKLRNYFQQCSLADPNGTYIVEACALDGDNELQITGDHQQLKYVYVAYGCTIEFWKHSRNVVAADGTHLTTVYGGNMYVLAQKDANNQLVILAVMECDTENKDNWGHFMFNCEQDFPGITVCLADWDKGLAAVNKDNLLPFKLSRCSLHYTQNILGAIKHIPRREAVKVGRSALTSQQLMDKIAKAPTDTEYAYWEGRLKDLGPPAVQAAKVLRETKDQFSAVAFLSKGIFRYGDTTSNIVEQANNVLLPLRKCGILDRFMGIRKVVAQKFFERQQESRKCDTISITKNTTRDLFTASQRVMQWKVELHDIQPNVTCQGTVQTHFGSRFAVKVFWEMFEGSESGKVDCGCGWTIELQRLCDHAVALLNHAQSIRGHNFTANNRRFYHPTYWVETYQKQYTFTMPPLTIVEILEDPLLIPFNIKRGKGRPAKRRKTSVPVERQRKCPLCKEPGHMAKTCHQKTTAAVLEMVGKI